MSSCHEFDQISNCFIRKTKQYIDMKLSLNIYLTNVLNTLKEQFCGGLSLRFRILMTSHETQQLNVENNSCLPQLCFTMLRG